MQRLYYITFITVLLLACKKDKTPCTDPSCEDNGTANCEPIEDIKKYFDFKVGSWWVYEEETSGIRDSVVVVQEGTDPNSYYFDIRVYSYHQDYFYHYWPELDGGCPTLGTICKRCIEVKRSKYKIGDFVDEAFCFIYIPVVGSKTFNYNAYYENNFVHVNEVYDTFSLDTLTFGKTVKMYEENSRMEGIQPTNHYFSKDVGLIRKELLDSNQVWNLVNYYVIQ